MKNKKIVFVFLLLTILILLTNVCRAETISIDERVDSLPYKFIIERNNNYYLLSSDAKGTYTKYNDTHIYFYNWFVERYNIYKYTDNTWTLCNDLDGLDYNYNRSIDCGDFDIGAAFRASNFDIYVTDSDTIFFQRTPALTVLVQGLEGVEMNQTMMEIVGLLPLAIGFLVLVIGLRKGLAVLLRILRAS